MSPRPIGPSEDYTRIAALPTRDWTPADAERMADMLTREYKTRTGTMRLRPIQGLMCADAYQVGGLFTGAGVGHGKTLASALIPTVLGVSTPLLFVPANLRDKTIRKDLPELRRHWKIHPRLQVRSYESLSTTDGAAMLDEIKPDLILLDECHKLKDTRTARTRRFLRYMQANPSTKIACFSGSITRKSLRNYWHLIGLALPEGSPLPYTLYEVERWADALDAGLEEWKRPAPGVLLNFCAPPDSEDRPEPLDLARRGFRRRLCGTWGVVMTSESSIGTSLVISERKVVTPPAITAALDELRNTWETPNGDELEQAVDVWRHARELACGFWYRWFDATRFTQCLEILKSTAHGLGPIEQKILSVPASVIGSDIDLGSALARLSTASPASSPGDSKPYTGSRSSNTMPYGQSTTGLAGSVGASEAGRAAYALTMITQPGTSGACSAYPAIGRSESWGILLRAYPALLPILRGAVEAAEPPIEWRAARKAWHRFVRHVLGTNRSQIDSPLQVARAYSDAPELLAWSAVRDSYTINSVPHWIDYYLIADAAKWLAEGDGIAWVEHRAVGEKLAELSGCPYYGGGPAASRDILDAHGPIIASIKAHGTGKNLQAYSRNLILSCPPAGDTWEQLIGRTHRFGQEADEVTIELYLNAEELRAGFTKSLDDARYIEYTTGQRQKLLYADKVISLAA